MSIITDSVALTQLDDEELLCAYLELKTFIRQKGGEIDRGCEGGWSWKKLRELELRLLQEAKKRRKSWAVGFTTIP